MKKNIISTVIAAALCTVAGSAMAAVVVSDNTTLTTTVSAVSSASVTVTPIDATVSVDDVKVAGTSLAAAEVSATGLYNGTTGANVKLTVDSSNYDNVYGKWLFTSGSESIKVMPELPSGWQFNGDNITMQIDSVDSVPATVINFKTSSANSNVTPGVYTMPVTMSFNTW
ncbi:hypothetical protein O5910_22965 [Escherichia coli]|nr:hypothetical protein [Escherichia coli]MCZ6323776.1 hypothetical protein [Escherichia coli]